MLPAILTTFLFALSASSAERSTRLRGGPVANLARLILASLFLACWAHVFRQGFTPGAFSWFFLSGVIGFGFGDLALYRAYPRLGARLSVLLCLCLAAPLGALFDWIWLGTGLTLHQVVWGTTILVGVALALAPNKQEATRARSWKTGVLMGVLAAAGQGSGAVMTRKAFDVAEQAGLHVDGGTAAYQRVLGGLILTVLVLLVHFRLGKREVTITPEPAKRPPSRPWRKAAPWVVLNSLSGPTVGVACISWALAIAPTGVVLAIVATTPLVVIPFSMILEGERPRALSLIGGVIAVAGAVCLVL